MTQMQQHDKDAIFRQRQEYKSRRAQNGNSQQGVGIINVQIPQGTNAATIASQLTTQLSQMYTQPTPVVQPGNWGPTTNWTISQTRTDGSMMGGRNEQAAERGARNVSNFHSTRQHLTDHQSIRAACHVLPEPHTVGSNECDSNANTCCAGTNFVVLQYTNRSADVYPYDSSYAPITNVPIVSAATAWTDPNTSETIILVLHECLFYGTSLAHTLWNPNQLRHHGTLVNNNPYDTSHDRLTIKVDNLTIPLHTQGTKVQFTSRSPTAHKLETCCHVELTGSYAWNPKDVSLGAVNLSDNLPCNAKLELSPFVSDSLLYSVNPALIDLKERALSQIRISSISH